MASALRNVLPAQPPSNVKEVGLYGYGAVVVASAFYGACYGLKEYSKQKTRKRRVFDGALKSFEGIYNTGKEGLYFAREVFGGAVWTGLQVATSPAWFPCMLVYDLIAPSKPAESKQE